MATPSGSNVSTGQAASEGHGRSPQSEQSRERQLNRWGGVAAIAGGILMLSTVAVVVALALPDASDPETLTDFADIESGRIAEHFLYLGALIMFALHAFVLHRLLRPGHPAAALFGTVVAATGLVIMAASSMLHVSTAPLADLYSAPDTPPDDQQMIEYAWHGAQSVFDTMLATGVLLVPIGIILFGIAMRSTPAFGPGLTWLTIGLGIVGTIGAAIEAIDTGSDLSAASVLAIVVFNLSAGWRTLTLGKKERIDPTGAAPAPVD